MPDFSLKILLAVVTITVPTDDDNGSETAETPTGVFA